jgi:HD-GYP domain-containing protein (c-di-GMP phosphodiesterase class II)
VHDLGKIAVPFEILAKPGKLTLYEFGIVKTHSVVGEEILRNLDVPWPIAAVSLQHHERIDGSGYPLGIKGRSSTLESRIIAVADIVEAMASHRPYREGLAIDVVLAEITAQGVHNSTRRLWMYVFGSLRKSSIHFPAGTASDAAQPCAGAGESRYRIPIIFIRWPRSGTA